MAVFTCYTTNGYNYTGFIAPATLNYLRIKEDGVIVVNLIPVIRNSDNTAGAYDLVNQKFYSNVGSGYFEAGPSV